MANSPKDSKTEDDKRRDKTLERMLKMPPKTHSVTKKGGGPKEPPPTSKG